MKANETALALLPVHCASRDGDYLVGDTIAATRQTLYRPTIYDDKGDLKPKIGIVVETFGNHLVGIQWDGYPHTVDYSQRELRGTTRRISRATPAKVWIRGYSRPIPAAYRTADGWVVDATGDIHGPLNLA